jgi:hypothetical protein
MAKRTRFPKRTQTRTATKRPVRPSAGTTAPASGRALPPAEPVDLDGSADTLEDLPLRSSSSLTDAEVERAAQLEAEATARDRAAIADSLRRRQRDQDDAYVARSDVNAPLSVRMSHEYAYVARDVRRILLTASLMVAILAVLAILINVLGVISL